MAGDGAYVDAELFVGTRQTRTLRSQKKSSQSIVGFSAKVAPLGNSDDYDSGLHSRNMFRPDEDLA
jgi:hypothetical protein